MSVAAITQMKIHAERTTQKRHITDSINKLLQILKHKVKKVVPFVGSDFLAYCNLILYKRII